MCALGFELPADVLGSLPDGVLFYPCSGSDFATPLCAFAPTVKEFWFVDTEYSEVCFQQKVTELNQQLTDHLIWENRCVWEPVPTPQEEWSQAKQQRYPWIKPLVCTEQYLHQQSGEHITVQRRKGYGVACLRKHEFESIAVFFYRGDSPVAGESSSGTLWLRENGMNLFGEVIARMASGSLIVSDGSNCSGGSLKALRQLHRAAQDATLNSEQADFQTTSGHRFKFVGRVDPRYGPTLAWRMQ